MLRRRQQVSRRASRRFTPSFGMDTLEPRAMLDGADGDVDPAVEQLAEDVENAVQADEAQEPGQVVANVQAMLLQGPDARQNIISQIEAVRDKFNSDIDAKIAVETTFHNNALAQMNKLTQYATNNGWPANWTTAAQTASQQRLAAAYQTAYGWEHLTAGLLKAHTDDKTRVNADLSNLEVNIWVRMVDQYYQDDMGNEVYATMASTDGIADTDATVDLVAAEEADGTLVV